MHAEFYLVRQNSITHESFIMKLIYIPLASLLLVGHSPIDVFGELICVDVVIY